MTTPICPVHNVPGRYAFGSMVVCELCHAGTAAVPAAQEKPATLSLGDARGMHSDPSMVDAPTGLQFTDTLASKPQAGMPVNHITVTGTQAPCIVGNRITIKAVSGETVHVKTPSQEGILVKSPLTNFSIGWDLAANEMTEYQQKPDDSLEGSFARDYARIWGRVNRQQHSSRPHALIVPWLMWDGPKGLALPAAERVGYMHMVTGKRFSGATIVRDARNPWSDDVKLKRWLFESVAMRVDTDARHDYTLIDVHEDGSWSGRTGSLLTLLSPSK